ncbi:alpha/beta-hydrolase, partial [Jaminaea rosea]
PVDDINTLMRHPAVFDNIRKPRHTIVLCHGLYGFDFSRPFFGIEIHYWAAVLDILRKKIGADVIVRGVPGTGSIASRAKALHEFLLSDEAGVRGQKVNFVGHSMGGLDARYLISHLRPKPEEYIPVSVTCISTPHRGSPFMDWCNANVGIGREYVEECIRDGDSSTAKKTAPNSSSPSSSSFKSLSALEFVTPLTRALSSFTGSFSSYMLSVLDQPAYAMLSTRYMSKVFNPSTPDMPNVSYFSIAARTRKIPLWHPLWLPKVILDAAAEARTAGSERDGSADALGNAENQGNDGLVSVQSAKWGTFLGVVEDADHWDLRGGGGPR